MYDIMVLRSVDLEIINQVLMNGSIRFHGNLADIKRSFLDSVGQTNYATTPSMSPE